MAVTTECGTVELGAGIPCTILAILLVKANSVMSLDQLASSVWGDTQPTAVVASLRNHIARLRRQLGPQAGARIRTVAPGYLIEVHEGELDEHVFVTECRRGRQALDAGWWAEASDILTGALALWRGEPFAAVSRNCTTGTALRSLEETRLLAWQGRNEAELQLGRHQELIASVRSQIDAHPLQEVFHAQLMLALYRAGRQAEALEVFHDLRGPLALPGPRIAQRGGPRAARVGAGAPHERADGGRDRRLGAGADPLPGPRRPAGRSRRGQEPGGTGRVIPRSSDRRPSLPVAGCGGRGIRAQVPRWTSHRCG
ncbi:AfsR/SARP family transcriptional regulator [Kitasatospora nipponensis]|uniref:AfsR/SARP family transcriptional regulator n=1 Tax=Kitasatospora nipponensis TaxID=258049 RepID=UPI0031D95FF4